MYQLTYVDYIRKSRSFIQPLQKGATKDIKMDVLRLITHGDQPRHAEIKVNTDEICWDWYWFDFWDDGTVNATYIGTECVPITPCEEAAIGAGGKLEKIRVDCYSAGTGGESNVGRFGSVSLTALPRIPGNDTTKLRAWTYVEGASGLFTYVSFLDVEKLWFPSVYTYHSEWEGSSFTNTPDPKLSLYFLGDVITGPNTSYSVGGIRNFTYAQAFHL